MLRVPMVGRASSLEAAADATASSSGGGELACCTVQRIALCCTTGDLTLLLECRSMSLAAPYRGGILHSRLSSQLPEPSEWP